MAGKRDIRIGVKVDGIDQTRQDFQAIGAEVQKLGPEGAAAAAEISEGFKQLESASEKAANNIAKGRQVSQRDLDAMIAKYSLVKESIEGAFPEGAPDKLSAALEKSFDRIAAVVKASDALPSSLEQARQAFRGLGTTIEETAKAADPLANLPKEIAQGFKAAGTALADFDRKFQTTGDVGPGELEKIIKAQTRLQIAIERSGKSLDELGPDAKAAFDTFEREATQATQTVQRLETAVDRNKVAAQSLAQGWGGLGDAVGQAMGKHADVAVQFSIIEAGLNSIHDAIQKTEEQMGTAQLGGATLSQTFVDLKDHVRNVAVAMQKSADDVAAAADVLGRTPPNADAIKTFYDEYQLALDKIGIAYLSGKDGQLAFQAALDAGLPRIEATYLANAKTNEVLEFQQQTLAAGKEGLAIWREAVEKSGGTAEGFSKQIERLTPVLASMAAITDEVRAAADRATAGWKAHRDEIEKVAKEQEKQIELTTKQVEQQLELHTAMDGMTEPLKHYLDWLLYAVPNVDNLTKAWGINVAKAQESLNSAVGLTAEEKKRYQGLIDLAKGAADLDDNQRKLLKSQLESALAMKDATESSAKWSKSAADTKIPVENLGKSVVGTSSYFIDFSKNVKKAEDALDSFMSKSDRAALRMKELQQATSEAAGEETKTMAPTGKSPLNDAVKKK